ncbi:MAG: glutamate decarboxylase [Propionibacteriaceae bacterium]|nr:glutamate decarboxylase [Propionibacteriaceae bacterium]
MDRPDQSLELNPLYARPGEATQIPAHRLPAGSMLPQTAYAIVHDEAMLDGNARLNLATFVTTWMEDDARRLYAETVDKNMIDKDEYPMTAEIENRCWRILADLWHAPHPDRAIGTSTTGSSEACMLAGLAMKRKWRRRQDGTDRPSDRPNLVMSSAVQVCWEKFCNYFDVEPRYVPITMEHPTLDAHMLEHFVDENTIGVVAIMGVTYTGRYEPVAQIAAALDAIAARRDGVDVPIHVDGASGAMIAPFLQPDLAWDFRIPRVVSINTSGHKYGLVYPGVGWVVWRDKSYLPDDLVFKVSYLGGDMPTLALNFSRPGSQVLLQYYLFLRLGFEGYTKIHRASLDVAQHLARGIGAMEQFTLWNDASDIPVFAWSLNPQKRRTWSLYDLSGRLRMHGWLVPAYSMPDNLSSLIVQRIVVRAGFSRELADRLLENIREETAYLDSLTTPTKPPKRRRSGFSH